MRLLRRIGAAALALLAAAAVLLWGIGEGWLGRPEPPGEVAPGPVPAAARASRVRARREAGRGVGVTRASQILFGDFHAHTTYSFDAFLLNLPLTGGDGAHPPAEACDFARYCSGLDFWSINDHAERLSRSMWQATVESVRQCNAMAGDPRDPDMVTFLGWEWSQIGSTPETHYGHKNVVLRDVDEGRIPTRPIGASAPGFVQGDSFFPAGTITMLALLNGQRGRDFAYLLATLRDLPRCEEGVGVRELPPDCLETAHTPEQLFEKLHDWGYPALVIPHGTTWGIYTPAASTWDAQLASHDPALQRMVEIYSGHGNAEEYRDWRATRVNPDGSLSCPEPGEGYLPSCWRSGELIRATCLEAGESAGECERRAAVAGQHYVDGRQGGWKTAPGQPADAWLDAGQCSDCFQPAFNYRPGGSVQYMLAVRDFADPARPRRFRFGFIGSSDNHTAKPGTGYKEFWRGDMTEGRGASPDRRVPSFIVPDTGDPQPESVPFVYDEAGVSGFGLFENERSTSFFLTGGLVAVHAAGRSRDAIWDALQRNEVYGTSGPRILLWFDLIGNSGDVRPMGASIRQRTAPRFRARAVGSFEQRPGCPAWAEAALGAERLDWLCRGECHHPSDRRRLIDRIEVIRIRPQVREDEPVGPLIEDPWRRFACDPDPAGCAVEFEDPDFLVSGRDTVYYVRAVEEPSLAIHGSNPLGCTRDERGRCIAVNPCGMHADRSDDCLSETQQRAWSSPIFVDFDGAP